MSFDPQAIRHLFPMLHSPEPETGQIPIFFDNPAGTQVPVPMMEKVSQYFMRHNANMGGHFHRSQQTEAILRDARQVMAAFVNAPQPEEIVFGQSMTTLNFALSRALAQRCLPDGEIVLTRMDHDANVAPWLAIARDYDLAVKWVDINPDDATLDMGSYEAALSEKTQIVAAVHASNAVGTINPVRQIADMAHAVDALFVMDAVQSAPHVPLDVQAIGCDFLLCSAYKFFGPHIGVMWGRYDLLDSLPAYKVRPAKDKPPYRWETGTLPFETIAGTAEAVRYMTTLGNRDPIAGYEGLRLEIMQAYHVISEYERELTAELINGLLALPGAYVSGITDPERFRERVATVSFTLNGHTPQAIAQHLGEHQIQARNGDYYATEIMPRLGHGEQGLVRVGLVHYNTVGEIHHMLNVLEDLRAIASKQINKKKQNHRGTEVTED